MIKNIDHANVIHYGFESLIIKSANGLGKPSCMKVLKEEFPSKEMLAQLDNEFNICSNAKCSSIRKAYKREKNEGYEDILLEYIDGKDLDKFLSTEQLTFIQQIHLATDITSALAELHKENIFHRRIHPTNIIIEQSTNKIFFIDFGLATQGNVFEEQFNHLREKEIETLKYIAPEQTGRINHAIDNRADLYSLGIILYLLFTAQLPFESDTRLELMYANIAKTPAKPGIINPNFPPVLSDIIMKLLAKNPEDRYQSAFGVRCDLEKCIVNFSGNNNIESFEIAQYDFSGKLIFSNKLYGREKEINFLNDLFQNCQDGQKKSCWFQVIQEAANRR